MKKPLLSFLSAFFLSAGCQEPDFAAQASGARSSGCPLNWRAWHECVHIKTDGGPLDGPDSCYPDHWTAKNRIAKKCAEQTGVYRGWQKLSVSKKGACFNAYLFEQFYGYLTDDYPKRAWAAFREGGGKDRIDIDLGDGRFRGTCMHVQREVLIDYLDNIE